MSEHVLPSEREMRYFIDDREVTEAEAVEAERDGLARVVQGGSGVVPTRFRQPSETEADYLRPWVAMLSRHPAPTHHRATGETLAEETKA